MKSQSTPIEIPIKNIPLYIRVISVAPGASGASCGPAHGRCGPSTYRGVDASERTSVGLEGDRLQNTLDQWEFQDPRISGFRFLKWPLIGFDDMFVRIQWDILGFKDISRDLVGIVLDHLSGYIMG